MLFLFLSQSQTVLQDEQVFHITCPTGRVDFQKNFPALNLQVNKMIVKSWMSLKTGQILPTLSELHALDLKKKKKS